MTINSIIADNGTATGLTKNGPGALTVATATNTYSGETVINGGTLTMDAAARYGSTSGFTLNGGTLAWTAAANLPKTFTLGLNGGTLNITSGGNQTIGVAGEALRYLGVGARVLTLNGVVDRRQSILFAIGDNGGPTSLTLAAAGDTTVMQLSGSNSYTGVTTISRGVLQLSTALSLPGGLGGLVATTNNTGGGNLIFAATGTQRAILELTVASGDFYRSLGTGFDQVQFTGNGGFSNGGVGTRIVNFGGAGATVTWGSGGFVPTGNILQFAQQAGNTNGSTGMIDFQNSIALGGAARTIDVSDGTQAAATMGVDVTLSGNLTTSAAAGGLTKTGTGVLRLTGDNTTGSHADSPTVVSGGYLIFGGTTPMNAILGSGATNRTITIAAAGGVVVTGLTNLQPLLDRLNAASAGSVLLDTSVTSTSAVINLNNPALASVGIGAYSDQGGTPIYYAGSIIPNGTTYRFSAPSEAAKGGQGPAASAVQRNTNLLVLTKQNVLTGSNSASFSLGTYFLTSANNFTGGVTQFIGSQTNIGIGHNAALGAGLINVGSTTDFIGSLNGDHVLSNNIRTAVAGNFVITGTTSTDGIANPGGFTFLGTLNTTGTVVLFARGNNPIFMGNLAPGNAVDFTSNTGVGFFSLLSQAAGSVEKTFTSMRFANTSTVVIDGDRSLGAVPGAAGTNLTFVAGTGILQVQPGTTDVSLNVNREILITANQTAQFNVPGGAGCGASSLTIPGIIKTGGTSVVSKTGLGTLALQGVNTFTATTANNGFAVVGGTLQLDYANLVGTGSILNNTTTMALVLGTSTNSTLSGGGTLLVSAGAANATQNFTNLVTTAKDNAVVVNSTGGVVTLGLGTGITRTVGGTLNFRGNALGTAVINSSFAAVNGIVPGATWNGGDLVGASGTALSAYSAYTATHRQHDRFRRGQQREGRQCDDRQRHAGRHRHD
ncbi:MAG: autotransporter-associated beta strand repeat-containing protein [Pirellulales bacterium]